MPITLRPYQNTWISDIRESYKSGSRSVLGVLPTGGGKTVCFSFMASEAARRGQSVGIAAHRTEIIDQISAALHEFDVAHGFIASGRAPNPFAQVQVCSIGAMARKIERYIARPFDFLIVDEAHHAAAGSQFHAVINAHRDKRILGVTATPERLSGEPLNVAFESMIVGPSTADLIKIGALSPYRAYAPSRPDLTGVHTRMGDYAIGELGEAMDRPTITGDAIQHYKRLVPGKRAVVFCVSIAHAEHIAEQFNAAGVKATSIDGKMSPLERREVIRWFVGGYVKVLTSCEIVSEGFDLPAIEAAILLRPTQSFALYRQQIGRSLRPFEGKKFAVILDHAGNIMRHGLPDDPHEWSLGGKGDKKSGISERTIPTVVCANCFAIFRPQPCCPECGVRREIEGRVVDEVEGELAEIDVLAWRELQKARDLELQKRDMQKEDKDCHTLREWMALAKKRGYRPGWAINRYTTKRNTLIKYGKWDASWGAGI